METIVHNPSELGRLASQIRSELGLRQSDVHAHTKLATRFIGEVENGKETAQIGKVMDMLESLGLELVIKSKSETAKVNPHQLGLSKVRFWSSGDRLSQSRDCSRASRSYQRRFVNPKKSLWNGPDIIDVEAIKRSP